MNLKCVSFLVLGIGYFKIRLQISLIAYLLFLNKTDTFDSIVNGIITLLLYNKFAQKIKLVN